MAVLTAVWTWIKTNEKRVWKTLLSLKKLVGKWLLLPVLQWKNKEKQNTWVNIEGAKTIFIENIGISKFKDKNWSICSRSCLKECQKMSKIVLTVWVTALNQPWHMQRLAGMLLQHNRNSWIVCAECAQTWHPTASRS